MDWKSYAYRFLDRNGILLRQQQSVLFVTLTSFTSMPSTSFSIFSRGPSLFTGRSWLYRLYGGFFHTAYAARLKQLYFSTVTRTSLIWYDTVVAISDADRKLFGRLRKHGIVCVENGVNVSSYANAASLAPAKKVVALGRLSSNKRLDNLITFIAALRQRDSQWQLKIAGRQWDIDISDIVAHAKTLDVQDAVEIVVNPNEDEIRQLMGQCSVIARCVGI